MKTAKEKVKEFVASNRLGMDPEEMEFFERDLVKLLKEQDRDTRHACAEVVINLPEVCETPTGGSAISPDDAHAACMNVKAV